jgi:DNA-binding protein Fis
VQENYLADAVKKFVEATVAKYDDGNADTVYNMVLLNQTRFANAFSRYVDAAIPDIKSAGTEPEEKEVMPEPASSKTEAEVREEKKQEFLDATNAPIEPTSKVVIEPTPEGGDSEIQKEYNKSMKDAADNMKIGPPAPAVDPNKVAKANIYRAMPDGINVAALNGTLTHLITENHEYKASEIYDMVIKDIDGFMVMLKNWCKNNDVPSGLEPKTEAPAKLKIDPDPPEKKQESGPKKAEVSVTGIDKQFRKSWVRLDLENFTKFVLQNCDIFKSDREEYDMAVAKFDRLKSKTKDTENLVFPFFFQATDAVQDKPKPELSTENSVLEVDENGAKEISIMKKYLPMFPDLSKRISETMGIDLETDNGAEAMKFNEKIEELLTKYENEHQTAYVESYEGGNE